MSGCICFTYCILFDTGSVQPFLAFVALYEKLVCVARLEIDAMFGKILCAGQPMRNRSRPSTSYRKRALVLAGIKRLPPIQRSRI
jgi:hypothetical protein